MTAKSIIIEETKTHTVHQWDFPKIMEAHKQLFSHPYKKQEIERGYANRTLHIHLSKQKVKEKKVSDEMKQLFTGGRGFGLKLLWDEIKPSTRWNSDENELIITTGPLCGATQYAGSGKSICLTVSPATNIICDSNVGGFFGPFLKFSGFDALEIQGKAKEDVIIVIDGQDGKIFVETAPLEEHNTHLLAEQLTYMYAKEDTDEARQKVSVVSAGQGAENSYWGMLNFSFFDVRRKVPRVKQAGRGGLGTVLRDKHIKAIVVIAPFTKPIWHISSNQQLTNIVDKNDVDLAKVDVIIHKWHDDADFVIEMFQDIQETFQHIPMKALDRVADKTGVSTGQLFHIASFYKSFSLESKGKTQIQVCMGTACVVRGATEVLESFERELGINSGQTTKDKKYSLEKVRCLGCCGLAPVITINDEVIGGVKPGDIPELLEKHGFKKKEDAQ
jgi:aldehyde:ferredoxin oxidoreductase